MRGAAAAVGRQHSITVVEFAQEWPERSEPGRRSSESELCRKRKTSSAGGIIAQECSGGIECRCSHLTAVAAWLPLKLQHTRALVMKMLDALILI